MRVRRLGLVRVVLMSCAALSGLWLLTAPAGAVSLPDGRVYEAVSPVETEGNATVYVPTPGEGYLGFNGEHGIITLRPFEVAPDGEAVVYSADPPPTGGGGQIGSGGGDSFLAKHSSDGWSAVDLQPSGNNSAYYQAFSSDLSIGIIASTHSLTPDTASGLYTHATSSSEYKSLYTKPLPLGILYAGANTGTSEVPGMTHILLQLGGESMLEGEGALEKELEEAIQTDSEEGKTGSSLYDSVDGRPALVSVLPDGKVTANASFGSVANPENPSAPGLSHVISADGSRIFWTDEDTGDLYMRENATSPGATTVQVDVAVGGGGVFWSASADGSRVFFTKGDLYEYDVNSGQTTDLTPGVEVLGVAGVSDDGKYIYHVDSGYKLNLWHEGVDTFIATLSSTDEKEVIPFDGAGEYHYTGDWERASGFRTAVTTPDGHSLLFMSSASLTGYDNEEKGTKADEVFLYEADSGKLRCVSCDPSGAPPAPTEFDNYRNEIPIGGFFPINKVAQARSQPRVISEDGSRVFFDSGEPLVSQDTNGWLDVYEWERDGTGSCHESHGCVYLLSGGRGTENSYLLGVSANGGDAFVISRAQLLPQDRNDNDDVYDARVGGMKPPPVSACSGAGCQGVPPAPPIFATPSSVTFSGVGNFSSLSKPSVKPRKTNDKPKLCRKGFARKHGRCVKKKAKKSAKGRKQHV